MSEKTLAFVFPGQGSQKVGMLAAAHQRFRAVRETFSEASDVLGYDMWDLIQNGQQDDLNLTETTQPVLLTSSVALWRAWLGAGGVTPGIMAGHSLGEFSALVCAGAVGFADALELVRQRGRFMQNAVPVGEGAMAAILGLEDETINRICAETAASCGRLVATVNFNSPGQVVIAGYSGAVDLAIERLREAGAKRALPLSVSAPFHTDLMQPAGDQLDRAMAAIPISSPVIPVVHNVHARPEANPDRIRVLLVIQIYSPVQWTRCIENMVGAGVTSVVECGPGKVLSGLNRRIEPALQSFSLENPEELVTTAQALNPSQGG